jgi:hypothetical protein
MVEKGPGWVTGVLAGLGRIIGFSASRCIDMPTGGDGGAPLPL